MSQTKSKEAQEAIANGADPDIIEEMEAEGELSPEDTTPPAGEQEPDGTEQKPDEGQEPEDGGEVPKDTEGTGVGDDTQGGDNGNIPAWKAKEMAKKAAKEAKEEAEREFDERIQDAISKAAEKKSENPESDNSDDINAIAEEFDIDPSKVETLVNKIGGVIEERTGIKDIKSDLEQRKARDVEIAEQQGFENEWSSGDVQGALKTFAGDREITPEIKEKVKEMAYSEDYAHYKLSDIVRLNGNTLFPEEKKPTAIHTAETGKGGTAHGKQQKTIEQMTPEEIADLSDDEFEKLSNKVSGSKYSVTRRNG